MEELREKTRLKVEALEKSGKRVVQMWQCEFAKMMEENQELKAFYNSYQPYMPINPWDPFFGGRTNAIRLFVQAEEGKQIRYVDFTR